MLITIYYHLLSKKMLYDYRKKKKKHTRAIAGKAAYTTKCITNSARGQRIKSVPVILQDFGA